MTDEAPTKHSDSGQYQRIHCIIEPGFKSSVLPETTPLNSQFSASYLGTPPAEPEDGLTVCIPPNGRLIPENSKEMSAIVSSAEELTNLALDAAEYVLGNSHTGMQLRKYRSAFYLEWRASLINLVRGEALWFAAADVAPWDQLMLVCHRQDTARRMAPVLRDKYGADRVKCNLNGQLVEGQEHQVGDPASPKGPPKTPPQIEPNLESLDQQIAQLPILALPRGKDPYIVFVTRWGLKTVPPTLIPLIRRLHEQAPILMINRAAAGVTASNINFELTSSKDFRDNCYVMESADFRSGARLADKPLLRQIVGEMERRLHSTPAPNYETLDLTTTLTRALPAFFESSLPAILSQATAFERFFSERQAGVVAVCPGRTSESAVIQQAARNAGIKSIDIMNAYMSDGYTYTAPLGDYVSAIDAWSEQLLINRFKIKQDAILRVSTPRFDEVPRAIVQEAKQRRPKTVVIATQPASRQHMARVIRALAELPIGDQPVKYIVKLHPRESDEDEQEYRRAAAHSQPAHSFEFTRSRGIYEVMNECDLVVVLFSNVGIEAALMDLPVVVAKLDAGPLPLPLDEFGIGTTAHSDHELKSQVFSLLHDESFQKAIAQLRVRYAELNPNMHARNSTDALSQAILTLFRGQKLTVANHTSNVDRDSALEAIVQEA